MPSEADRSIAAPSEAAVNAVVSRLVHAMVQAARDENRAVFDRLFALALHLTHGPIWKSTGEASEAERHTAQALLHAVLAELEAVARSDASTAPR